MGRVADRTWGGERLGKEEPSLALWDVQGLRRWALAVSGSLGTGRMQLSACVLVPVSGRSPLASAALPVHPRAWGHSSHLFPPGPSRGMRGGGKVLVPGNAASLPALGGGCFVLSRCPPAPARHGTPTSEAGSSFPCSPQESQSSPGPDGPPGSQKS